MAYEYFYPGTKYSLESPIYGNSIAYNPNALKFSSFGLSTDPRIGNQLQETSSKLNTGMNTIEVEGLQPDIFESIPKQQFKEINRLAKLTGSEATLHGPLIEASGYSREGWSEVDREGAERQMKNVIERAHEISPDGNIPVTFHSSVMLPEGLEKAKIGGEIKPRSVFVVDPRTGRLVQQIKEEEKHFPGQEGPFDYKKEIERMNKDAWTQEVGNINISARRGEEIIDYRERIIENNMPNASEEDIGKVKSAIFNAYAQSKKAPMDFKNLPEQIGPIKKQDIQEVFRDIDHASIFLKDAYRGLRNSFNMVYQEASPEDKKKLKQFAEDIKKEVENGIDSDPAKIEKFADMVARGVSVLDNIQNPKLFKPLDDFVVGKAAQTFAAAAFHGYKEYGEKAPIVSIENPPAGTGLSRAEDLKALVERAREEFVKKAKKEGMSESEASDAAKKLIGVTWDVGHINMLRKYGYEKEDLLKQAGMIKPFLKHVHLSDNFGMEHTELPMGMGNVPIKEMMEKLGKEGFEAKKIIEAGNWWQHMKTPPVVPTLEAFGSPLYPMLAQPSWTQAANAYGNYFAFPSAYFPEQHFSLYGSGFANLPQELGGQIPGKQNRLTGTPMD